jgi:predicted transcriptional regulator
MLPYDPDLESYYMLASPDLEHSPFREDLSWRAVRKLSNEPARHVVICLLNHPGSNFGEMRNLTGLSLNDLNHALNDMKQLNLIIYDHKKYYLTKYCVALICSLSGFVQNIRDEDVFAKYEKD